MRSYLKAPELWHAIGYVVNNGTGYLMYEKATTRGVYLSVRESEILQRLCDGESNKLIAIELDISPATVSNHIRSLLNKYQIKEVSCLIMETPSTKEESKPGG
ncbi:hypothetical protein A3759_15245 [Thalassolituus sp. HI0120]|nr:hypothetical protein A3759_15245 [Thalassolituus sp. HI0120]